MVLFLTITISEIIARLAVSSFKLERAFNNVDGERASYYPVNGRHIIEVCSRSCCRSKGTL